MSISINQISSGMALLINDEIHLVQEYHHVKPGKGSAFVRVKLKNVRTDAVLDRTFKTADKLDDAVLEDRELEFLYVSGDSYFFMDHTTYEQVDLDKDVLGGVVKFLLENLEVTGLFYNNKAIKVVLPTFITARIAQTEPGIKGDSSRAGTKPANIETGTMIQVPLFVNTDDWVKIDTRTGEYVERVTK